jgi:hypothetical protein
LKLPVYLVPSLFDWESILEGSSLLFRRSRELSIPVPTGRDGQEAEKQIVKKNINPLNEKQIASVS